jgi:hypothetical protein
MDEKVDQHHVAKHLGVSTKTVRALIRRGEYPRRSNRAEAVLVEGQIRALAERRGSCDSAAAGYDII